MTDKIEFFLDTEVPLKKNNLPYFQGSEKYWVISSGKEKDLYDYFYKNRIVGLAWDKIKVNDIKGKNLKEINKIVENKYLNLKSNYEKESSFSRAITIFSKEVNYFVNEIKLGDIVIVKDRSRNNLIFGKVVSEVFENKEFEINLKIDDDRGMCNKFLNLEWLNIREKDEVSELIKNTIYGQQAILNITDERTIADINKTIFSLFYRDNYIHAIFNIKKDTNIEFEKYYQFLNLIHEFRNDKKIKNDFYIKSNVSSPGPIEIFGNAIEITNLLISLGIITTVGVATAYLKNKYLPVKKELDIINPGVDDGFDRGN